jgi:hypothetical protein
MLINNLQKCGDGIKTGKMNRDKNGYSIDHRAFYLTVMWGKRDTSSTNVDSHAFFSSMDRLNIEVREIGTHVGILGENETKRRGKKRATAAAVVRRLVMLGQNEYAVLQRKDTDKLLEWVTFF